MFEHKMTFEELDAYCREYRDVIFVRALVDGKWGAYSLAELPESAVAANIMSWYLEGVIPSVMLES